MVQVIPPHIKEVWDRWNIRGSVILSLTLQAILIIFSPLRKRTPRRLLIILVWTSYLLADWSANFAVGLISSNQGKEPKKDDPPQDKKLMALWAPFLLLHLGGPDTITAFALEDNALWLRHFIGLVFQAIAGVYVVLLSLPNSLWVIITLVFVSGTIKYLERTTALYSASLDKFRDSMVQAPDPGPNYAKLMEEYKAKKDARLPTKIVLIDEPDKKNRPKKLEHPSASREASGLTHLEIAQYSYRFFNTFKGLVVNLIFSFRERDESLEIFDNLSDPVEALRIIEVELGFLYDALFTKIAVLHTISGTISRFIAFGTLGAAFVIFDRKPNKRKEFPDADVVVTYTLFSVGIALEFVSIIFFLFSDWTFATWSSLKDDQEELSLKDKAFNWLLGLRDLRWKKQNCYEKGEHKCTEECKSRKKCNQKENHKCPEECKKMCVNVHEVLTTRFFLRRWCGSIYVFNFIAFATKAKVERIHDSRGSFRRYWWMIISYPFELIGSVLRKIWEQVSSLIDEMHKRISHKVNAVSRTNHVARVTIHPFYFGFLSRIPHFIKSVWVFLSEFFDISDTLDKIRKTMYVHGEPMTKQLWELMFEELKNKSKFGDSPENARKISLARGEWTLRDTLPEDADREKLIEHVTNVDYDQSILMWHIATELCYQSSDTISKDYDECTHYSNREFSKIISDYMMYLMILQPGLMSEVAGIGKIRFRDTLAEAEKFFERRQIENKGNLKLATETLLDVKSDITDPMSVKGDRSKSVLFDACRLAKDLMLLEERFGKNKWEILSKVWVELLCHAACHCDPTAHVEQLSRGGELINFVWLLMAHFGLTDQFQINKGDARAKLIIGK